MFQDYTHSRELNLDAPQEKGALPERHVIRTENYMFLFMSLYWINLTPECKNDYQILNLDAVQSLRKSWETDCTK